MSDTKIYFRNLDAIRFIAASMVVLGHAFGPSYEYLHIKGTFIEKLLYTISSGGTGVSIFFVLSGFLITYLLVSEHELNHRISLRNFYIRRILRIWPLYFTVVAFSFLIYPALKSMIGMNNPLGSNVLYHLTFLSNFDVMHIEHHCYGSEAMSQNITWSVSVEEQFYLFWPLIFVVLPRRFWLTAIVAVIGGSLLFRIINTGDGTVLYFHTFAVLLDLGVGGLTALLIKSNDRVRMYFQKCSTRNHAVFFVLAFCLVLWSDELFSFPFGNAIGRLFIAASFALVIAAQALTTTSGRLNLGNWKFADRWGKYTYGIYLLHPVGIIVVDVFCRTLHFSKNGFWVLFVMAIASSVLTLMVSKISYVHFESRFLAMKDRFTFIRSHR